MGLLLPRRSYKLGNSLTVNTQHHGNEDVSAIYLPFKEGPITEEELPEITLEKRAYKLLYRKWKGRPDQAVWGRFAPVMHCPEKVKGVNATIFLGRRSLKVVDAVMASLRLEPKEGGVSFLSFTFQIVPELDENHPMMEALFSRVNQKVDMEIECETYGAQPELPLEEEEEDPDADEGEDEDPPPESGGNVVAMGRARKGKRS